MHFISGQCFTVSNVKQSGPKVVSSIQSQGRKQVEGFETGLRYTIYYIRNNHIKAVDENKKFTYTFLDERGNKVEKDFSNALEADTFIAKLAGIEIPNYNHIYERRTT